jgi:hypothetical protein
MSIEDSASLLLSLVPVLYLAVILFFMSTWLYNEEIAFKGALPLLMLLVGGLIVMPNLINILNGPVSENQELFVNETIISKRVEYSRGLFSIKEKFVFILSDGDAYRVPEDIFYLYDTGDRVEIKIDRVKGKVTFR